MFTSGGVGVWYMITLILHLVQTQDTLVQLHQLSLVHDYNDLPFGADVRYQWLTDVPFGAYTG